MRIALKSALMLTTRVIQIINPELHLHMQRTALIALELAQASGVSRQQQTIFCAALLHDIGVLGDKRVFSSLNAIDNLNDPHQHRGAEMLAGLATLAPILPIIRDHHFSPPPRKPRTAYRLFRRRFERLLAGDKSATTFKPI
jgi:putative nucleotidyltransferase with HDIG domain